MSKPRVLLIGWDAADWKVIQPLLEAGQMPNLARLMAGGVHGNLATLYPVLSPMLWTSIATGKRAYKHGIHGFTEPLPDGSGVRPVSLLSRKTKAVWNILNQTGHRSIVVGWWPSHPAEPLNGVMVSNHFAPGPAKPGELPPLPAGAVYPASLAASLGELRVSPMELSGRVHPAVRAGLRQGGPGQGQTAACPGQGDGGDDVNPCRRYRAARELRHGISRRSITAGLTISSTASCAIIRRGCRG